MNIDDLTIGQAKALAAKFSQSPAHLDNGMVGKYVIVRCHNAGVHAGTLESYSGREAVLTNSRRLWYWKPADKKSFLSGVAMAGLHKDSKVGVTLPRLHLTETCEIIECSAAAAESIAKAPDHDQ
jgi:hypothetical protein